MSTVLCSAAVGPHVELLALARPTYERYADAHGYDVDCATPGEWFTRPPSWFKLIHLRELLECYDTAVWVDADALFVRYDLDITDACSSDCPLWMVKHKVAGLPHLLPNAGVLVAHRDDRLFDFFDRAWEQTGYIDHPWWEQAAILHLLGYRIDPPGGYAHPGEATEWTGLIGWLDTEWNSMPHDPHPNPVIRHYSGMRMGERLAQMTHDTAAVAA